MCKMSKGHVWHYGLRHDPMSCAVRNLTVFGVSETVNFSVDPLAICFPNTINMVLDS